MTLSGSRFSASEHITLALNGEALPPTLTADRGGRFRVQVPVPSALLIGANTLSAFGNSSRRVALASLRGLGGATEFYFAGGVSDRNTQARVDLLNATTQSAHVRLTFYFQAAEAGGPYALAGPPADFAVNGSAGTITLRAARANRAAYLSRIAAMNVDETVRVATNKRATGGGQYVYELVRSNTHVGNEYRGKMRLDNGGRVHIQVTKVLANVETNLGREVVVPGLIYRPTTALWMRLQVRGTVPTRLRMKVWPVGQVEPSHWQYGVADSEPKLQQAGSVGLRAYLSGKSTNASVLVSFADLRVTSATGSVLAADLFNRHVKNGWEGSASPTTSTAFVTVAAHSQRTALVSDLVNRSGSFGLVVQANRAIAVQLTTNRYGRDGDTILGVTGLNTRWYFAEGYTGLTFHETIAILNPDPRVAADIQLQLLPSSGERGRTVTVQVPPTTHSVVDVNHLLPGRSLSVIATSSHPIVVERTLTFSSSGYGLTTRMGTAAAATSWIFAEGTTVNRFQTFLTILNPGDAAAHVMARFYGPTGGTLGHRTATVAPRSRATIKLNDVFNASGIASVVTSDRAIVVEQPEYFGSPNVAHIAGSDVFGRSGVGRRWSFPDGETAGTSEFVLLYNPYSTAVPVNVTFYGSNGRTVRKRVYVQPSARYTFDVNRTVRGLTGQHGIVVQTANGDGIVAEQTLFTSDHRTLRSTQGLGQ